MRKIYHNGDIITMESRDERPSALVTQADQIVFVGSYEEAKRLYPEAENVDLAGKTLMPGFIDPHSHFFQTAQSIRMCDLSKAESFADVTALLSAYHKANPEAEVILASGYDHNFLKEERHPDKSILDQVSETLPIFISHISGHMGIANAALLRMAGIADDTPDPDGGRFGRDAAGALTGYVEEIPALMRVLGAAMPLLKFDMPAQICEAQKMYLRYGVTTVQEGAASKEAFAALVALAEKGLIGLDVVTYIMQEEYADTAEKYADYTGGSYVDHIRIGGAKIILDGSPQGKSAWLSRPYEQEESCCGYPAHDLAYVKDACQKAIEGRYQILAHCNGDAASEQFIEGYEDALKEWGDDPREDSIRPVMIHCQTVRDDQLDRMLPLQMIPSVFAGHIYYWGDVHKKNLGSERAERISPLGSMCQRGMIYNMHQDTPVTKPDMLHTVWCAVNRMTRKGQRLGSDQCISVYDALKGVTIHAAYAYGEEKSKGTLKAGKQADMVILSENPLKIDPMKIKDIRVEETIKGGIPQM